MKKFLHVVKKLIIGLLIFFGCWLVVPAIYNLSGMKPDGLAVIGTILGFFLGALSALHYWFDDVMKDEP